MILLERFSGRFAATVEGREFFQIGLVVFILSFAIKFILVALLYSSGGDSALLFGESKHYFALSENMISGEGFYYKGNLESFRPPGLPLYFVPFIYFDIPIFFAAFLQILIASLIPVLAVYCALHFLHLPRNPSLAVGVLAAIEPMQTFYGSVLLPDVLFSALFIFGCVALVRWLETHTVHDLVLAGLALGLANYIRPAGLYLMIFLIVGIGMFLIVKKMMTLRRLSHLILFAGIFFMVLAPWYLRNHEAFGEFSFVSMTAHLAYVYSAIAAEAASQHVSYEVQYQILMKEARQVIPNPGYLPAFENAPYLTERALEIIWSHPREYVVNYLLGLNTYWFSGNYHYLLSRYGLISFPEKQTSFSMILAGGGFNALWSKMGELFGSAYLFFAIIGKLFWFGIVSGALLGAYFFRSKPFTVVFLICIVYASATLLLTTYGVEARHRYMLNPLLFTFFVATLHHVYEAYLHRRTSHERRGGHTRVSA